MLVALANSVSLEWSAPDGCPAKADVLKAVSALDSHPAATRPLFAEGTVRELPTGRFELRLQTRRANTIGVRTVELDACSQATDVAAVILSLALEEDRAAAPTPEAPNPRVLEWLARARGTASVGLLPGLSAGVGVSAGIAYRRLRVELGLDHLFGTQLHSADRPTAGGTLELQWALMLDGCFTVLPAAVEIQACLGGGYGQLAGTGNGVTEPLSAKAHHAELHGGVGFGVHVIGPMWLRLDALAAYSVTQPRFIIEGVGELYRVPPVSGRGGLGIEVRL